MHTVVFMLHSVLFLYAQNLDSVLLKDVWLPLGYLTVATALTFLLHKLVLSLYTRAGLATSACILLFFSYGHYVETVYVPFSDSLPAEFKYDVYIWASVIIYLILLVYLYRSKSNFSKPTQLLNLISVLLFAPTGYKLIMNEIDFKTAASSHRPEISLVERAQYVDTTSPNIYYFIMDAYGRNDVLRNYYGHDNSEFTHKLENLGFYVADKSVANYNKTIFSVPSALNMEYLDTLAMELGVDSEEKEPLFRMFNMNRTMEHLKQMGYEIVSFDASVWSALYVDSADVFYHTPDVRINMFHSELYNLSILRALQKRSFGTLQKRNAKKQVQTEFDAHRKKILHGFDRLREISKMDGPFYVHAHFLSPHQPFVFDEEGNAVDPEHEYSIWIPIEEGRKPEEYRKRYISQLKFINQKLIETITVILKNSKTPPIIIIQGDHGPCSELRSVNTIEGNDFNERMPILNVYYFPDGNYNELYPGITPVNSFRLIFSKYFGLDYPLLPDSSFYSTWKRHYDFVNVTDSIEMH